MMIFFSKRRVVVQLVLSLDHRAATPFSDTAVGKFMDSRSLIEMAEKV
jgi:hypothetical protein